MNTKPIVAVAIALTVGIVTFSGVLIPAIESGVNTEDTFTNTGLIYASELNEDTTMSMSWDHTKPNILTVDGEDMVIPSATWPVSVAFSESWVIRVFPESNGYIQLVDATSGYPTLAATVSQGSDMSIEINSGTLSATVGTTTKTNQITTGLVIDDNGNYVLKKSTDSAYILSNSIVYCAGYTSRGLSDSINLVNIFTFSVDEGIDIWSSYPPSITHTETIDNTEIHSHIDLYSFKSITMEIEDTDEHTGTAVYSQVYVPAEVTAEKSIHADASTILLFQTIPVFIVLGMIVAVVGVLYMKTRR